MPNVIIGKVEGRRVVAEVPDEWPDGTEVHVTLVCRPGLTAKDQPRSVEEMIAIDRLFAAEERRSQADES